MVARKVHARSPNQNSECFNSTDKPGWIYEKAFRADASEPQPEFKSFQHEEVNGERQTRETIRNQNLELSKCSFVRFDLKQLI
jgi:hypothetical protein